MFLYKRFIQPLFFSRRFYLMMAGLVMLFVLSFGMPALYLPARILLGLFGLLSFIDYLSLYIQSNPVQVSRICSDRFSNGDENNVTLHVHNKYPFRVRATVIDEVPVQMQWRQFQLKQSIEGKGQARLHYSMRPVERGEYFFQSIHVFAHSPLGLITRRITIPAERRIRVLPSYLLLKQFELKAHTSNLTEAGSRKIRKIGHSLEFEQIKEYVNGDDIRSINWKATARRAQLMVNNYTDEKSQQVYCIVDKGRVMKMPFEKMALLDYAINATLILSRVALLKQDKAGLITFDEQIGHFLPADRKAGQMNTILETLYNQETKYLDSDYEKLYALIRTRVTQRSLFILFTNFESLSGLQRQLPYIRAIARNHLVLVVFFENTELRQLTEQPAHDMETLYIRTIAEKFAYEKRLIVKELQQHGIFTILTAPKDLTVDTVNKYLELKARQAI